MLKTKKFFLLCFLSIPLVGAAHQRAANGPVESVDFATQKIVVLGQVFSVNAATKFVINGRALSSAAALRSVAASDSVAIVGHDFLDGSIATLVELSSSSYVPGASSVYLLGKVTAFSPSTAKIRIGSLVVDGSAIAPEVLSELRLGSAVEVIGTQPNKGGIVVRPSLTTIGGNGLRTESIGGTGRLLESIGGTGLQMQSIGGTGRQVQSIGGTGVQTQSIGGTGRQLQSIGGTGRQTQSIGGTGRQLQSIGDTGVQLQSIGGTGRQLQSIGGTGRQTKSIGGTGRQLQSIGGTGVQIQSIGGTGRQLQQFARLDSHSSL